MNGVLVSLLAARLAITSEGELTSGKVTEYDQK
jgi:hypothetical protein